VFEDPSLESKKRMEVDRILKPKIMGFSEASTGRGRTNSVHLTEEEAEEEDDESDGEMTSDDYDDSPALPPLVSTGSWAKYPWKSPTEGSHFDGNSSCAGSVSSSGSKFLAARNVPPPDDVSLESLPPEIVNKYFGPESKIHFYEVYRALNQKKNILSIGGYIDDADSGYMSLLNASSVVSTIPPPSPSAGDESEFSVVKLKSAMSKKPASVVSTDRVTSEQDKKEKARSDGEDAEDAGSIFSEDEAEGAESGQRVGGDHNDEVSTMASGSSIRRGSAEEDDDLFDEMSVSQSSSAFGTTVGDSKKMKQKHSKKIVPCIGESSRETDEGSESDFSTSVSALNINSPRTRFLSGCIANNIPPRNALVLRSKLSTLLFLEHHGIGDELAQLLASALGSMPLITSVNLADNNLNDDGLEPLLLSLVNCPMLREINFSENIIGPRAASALAALLSTPQCKIQAVRLKKANVDDGECQRFVDALRQNRHLEVGVVERKVDADSSSHFVSRNWIYQTTCWVKTKI
jgi:hypothetical protein